MKTAYVLLALVLVSAAWAPSAHAKKGADDGPSPASPAAPKSPASPRSPAPPSTRCKAGFWRCGNKCYRPSFVKAVKCAKGVFTFACKPGHLKCGPTCCPLAPAGGVSKCKVYPNKKTQCEFECKEGWRKCSKVRKCCKKPCKC